MTDLGAGLRVVQVGGGVVDNVQWGHLHPDVRVRALAAEVEQLRAEVARWKAEAEGQADELGQLRHRLYTYDREWAEVVGDYDPIEEAP